MSNPTKTMIAAPNAKGKGVGFVIPQILNWGGSIEVHDPKPSLPQWPGHKFQTDRDTRPEWNRQRGEEDGK